MMDPLLAFIIFPYDLDQVVNNDILYFTDKQLQPLHRTPCQMSRWTHLQEPPLLSGIPSSQRGLRGEGRGGCSEKCPWSESRSGNTQAGRPVLAPCQSPHPPDHARYIPLGYIPGARYHSARGQEEPDQC